MVDAPCALCGDPTNPCGLEVFLAAAPPVALVCDECTQHVAPELLYARTAVVKREVLLDEDGDPEEGAVSADPTTPDDWAAVAAQLASLAAATGYWFGHMTATDADGHCEPCWMLQQHDEYHRLVAVWEWPTLAAAYAALRGLPVARWGQAECPTS
jgi:hypothetical protein